MWDRWDDVVAAGHGVKADYRLDGKTIGRGGQATVSAGTHRATGTPIAFKKLLTGLARDPSARARMRYEIEIGTQLRHRHAVPVLDSDPNHTWFVMPLAQETAESRRHDLENDDALIALIRRIGKALAAAHEADWVHRDIKPANILRFSYDRKYRWAVSDWGLGRRPPGTTSMPGLTQTGMAYGTEGFSPPELSTNAHAATAAADVYSLGQLIGWVKTGQMPIANTPLLPASGPWRTVIAAATRQNPALRPQTIDALLELIDEELDDLPPAPVAKRDRLLAEAAEGNLGSAVELLHMATAQPDDFALFADYVADLETPTIKAIAKRHPDLLEEVMEVARHVGDGERFIPFHLVVRIETLAIRTLAAASALGLESLASSALKAFCEWDDGYDRWTAQNSLRPVLRELRGVVAEAAARVLRRHPTTAARFEELAGDNRVADPIRGVIAAATSG